MSGASGPAGTAAVAAGPGADLIDPSTGETFDRVSFLPLDQLDQVMRTAAEAQVGWARSTPAERATLLRTLATELERREPDLVDVISRSLGLPRHLVAPMQIAPALSTLRGLADTVETYEFVSTVRNSVVRRVPAGVVAAISPWNYPLLQSVNKVAAALAAGCAIVLKPSELTPLDAIVLAEAALAAGLPPGVFQVVIGDGVGLGQALVSHPLSDVVSFTGSTEVGRLVAAEAATTFTRVSLELGGKSANIVLPGADLDAAVRQSVGSVAANSGQTCTALSRLLVPRDQAPAAQRLAGELMSAKRVGPGSDHTADLGPVISRAQQSRVQRFVTLGIEEGATLVTGGATPPEGHDAGFYVRPTVFGDVEPSMTIAREEIFGPVLAVIAYDDVDDAVVIANDSQYGLSGAVWGADIDQATDVAGRIRTGQVAVNGGPFNPVAPFGGMKHSGIGREKGEHGIDEFVELQSLQMPTSSHATAHVLREVS